MFENKYPLTNSPRSIMRDHKTGLLIERKKRGVIELNNQVINLYSWSVLPEPINLNA